MQSQILHTIPEACSLTHTGRTSLYMAIRSGDLRAVKRGRRTLILDHDLHRWVQSLPPITVKRSGTMVSKGSTTERKDGEKSSVRKHRRLQ